jgi:hypothetical protein
VSPTRRGYFPFLRLWDLFSGFPERLLRWGQHTRRGQVLQLAWWVDGGVLLADLLGVAIFYEIGTWLTKWNLRPLTAGEIRVLTAVFGATIDYRRVRIDERAHLGPRQYPICYVSFYSINSWGPMTLATLVHEAVHIWQYERVGAAYIPRALRAQHSPAGYDYGGGAAVSRARSLWAFNYEQQADIVADYWCLSTGNPTRWLRPGEAAPAQLAAFEKLLRSAGLLAEAPSENGSL